MRNKAFIWTIIIIVLVGYGLSKVGDIGIWGSAKLQSTFSVEANEVYKISVDLTSSDLEIEEYKGDKVKVEVYSNRDLEDIPTVEQSGTTMVIKENKKLNITIGISFGNNRVQIYIPEGTSLEYELEASSGNIEIKSIQALQIDAKTSSGNIKTDIDDTSSMQLKASSGNIKVKGNILKLKAEASSGNIDLDRVKSNEIYTEASSGNIKGEVEANKFTADTSSGNIDIDFLEMPKISVITEASSGNIELGLPDNDGFELKYSTSSGYVKNEFTDMKEEDSGTDIYEGGSVIIQASTTSGNIKIED
ncbi:MAG: hypothetical protein K0R15_871 [Clostridiales bacterium]|jgi:DUF4097 and DUF4098 domain-containing protein YvlB|nr:hypothetical protein [Clostridiales bacterium]